MPNAKVLEAKQAQVAEAVELIKSTQTGILVDYRGLNVAEDTELRNKLREANVKYFVIKNKILKRAVDEIGLEGLDEVVELVLADKLLKEDGIFIFEHSDKYNFENHPYFWQSRSYGSVQFSFFKK